MKRGFSCYLDLIRVLAAGTVFLHHLALDFGCYAGRGGCGWITELVPFHTGHSAVVIFFVLSGYVITYVATERERTPRAFAIARIARIYSVALPVLALVMALDALAMAMGDHSGIPDYQYASLPKYLPLILTFSTDHWFLAENAFSLGAWWSVAYEVWYYILFAACFFLQGWRRWLGCLAVMLVIGPKLLALFPLWALGSLVYRLHRSSFSPGPRAARAGFIASAVLTLALLHWDGLPALDTMIDGWSGGWISAHLRFSQWFVGDFAVACVFAFNVYAARYVALEFGRATGLVRFVAGYTFTFYLIHGPVQKAIAKLVDDRMLTTALATIAFTFVFGTFTEQQKGRLRRLLERAFRAPARVVATRL